MKIALLGTSTLIGGELKDVLSRSRDLYSELRLLTLEEDSSGKVSDIDGEATFIRPADAETLADIDLLLVPSEVGGQKVIDLMLSRGAGRVVAVGGAVAGSSSFPLVDGVNLEGGSLSEAAASAKVVSSPHPTTIGLALLLAPLGELAPLRAAATVVLPASMSGQEGLDEVLNQSRSILNFQETPPTGVFGHQLAFNMFPNATPLTPIVEDLKEVLGSAPRLSLQLLQAGVFHSCAVSLHLDFEESVGATEVRGALEAARHVRVVDREQLGPIDSAAQDEIQVGGIVGTEGSVTLWGVFDNLTRGGASNATAIVSALSAGSVH